MYCYIFVKFVLDYPIYELKKVLIRDSYTGDSVDITKYCYDELVNGIYSTWYCKLFISKGFML